MTSSKHIEEVALRIVDGQTIDDLVGPEGASSEGTLKGLQVIDRISRVFRRQDSAAKENPIQVGDTWGHLKIDSLLGAGGMGQVFKAYDSILDAYVAVKFLSPKALQFIDTDLFIAEARRMAKVRHPNVLAVLGAGIYDDRPGFWSEYLTGQDLHAVLLDRALDEHEVLAYSQDLANALAAVHNAGLLHGDVKPLNVMIEPERGAILMDFGAGIDVRKETESPKARQVTPAIMPPEQLDGHAISSACDIYALGVVYYSLWTRRPPFVARSIGHLRETLRQSRGVDLTPVSASKEWKSLIGSMLSRNPADRPDIEKVQVKLRLIRSAPLRKARRATLIASAVFLVALTAVSGFAFLNSRSENLRTQAALAESENYVELLGEIVTSASSLATGKDTRMVNVIAAAESRLARESAINEELRLRALKLFAETYSTLDQREEALRIAEPLSGQMPDVIAEIELQTLIARQLLELDRHADAELRLQNIESLLADSSVSESARATYWALSSAVNRENGQFERSRQAVDKALRHSVSSQPEVRAVVQIELGHLLNAQSEFDAAIGAFEHGLQETRNACVCQTNANTIVLESEIGIALLRKGEVEPGVDRLRQATQEAQEFLGPDHVISVTIAVNFLGSLNEQGEYEELIDRSLPLLPIIEGRYGKNSTAYTSLQTNRANAFLNLRRYDEARTIYEEIIDRAGAAFGDADLLVLMTRYNLAELNYKSGQPQAALDQATAALDAANQALGSDHLVTLELRDAIGWSLHLLGRHSEAVVVLTELLSKKNEILGAGHPLTQSTQEHLQAATQAVNKPDPG